MKNKIISLVLCFLMCCSVLTGCNLFSTDLESYYNAVVATINYDYTLNGQQYTYSEEITKRELITAYNNYGYQYYESYGYTISQAMDLTLDYLINNKLVITDVKNYYKKNNEELLNNREKTYLWQETYDALYENLRDYYVDIVGEDDEEDDEEEDSGTVYEEYEQTAVLTINYDEDGNILNYSVKKITPATTIRETGEVYKLGDIEYDIEYTDNEGNYTFKELIYETLTNLGTNDSPNYWKTAFNQYLSAVRDSYSYMDLGTDEECFYFELDRIYKILYENYLIEKYEELYNEYAKNGSTLTNVRAENVVTYYTDQVLSDYETYKDDEDSYQSAMVDTSTLLNYVNTASSTSYFNVAIIKIDLSDEIEALDDKLTNGDIDKVEYNEDLASIFSSATVSIKDSETGLDTGNTITASNLLAEIESTLGATRSYLDYDGILTTLSSGTDDEKAEAIKIVKAVLTDEGYYTLSSNGTYTIVDTYASSDYDVDNYALSNAVKQLLYTYISNYNKEVSYEKADAFINYFYYYNDDTTFLNADKNAVFGVTKSGSVVYSDGFSDYECDALTDAILALYNSGNAQVGDLSDLVYVDGDGVYIIFYAGAVENLFGAVTNSFSLALGDIATLASTRINIFSKETYFDNIYDTLLDDDVFSNFEEKNLNYLKQTLTTADDKAIQKHYDEYKDLLS